MWYLKNHSFWECVKSSPTILRWIQTIKEYSSTELDICEYQSRYFYSLGISNERIIHMENKIYWRFVIPSKITIFILMAKDIILATSNIGKDICNKFPATLELTNVMNEDTWHLCALMIFFFEPALNKSSFLIFTSEWRFLCNTFST